jgi:hypothetical protein
MIPVLISSVCIINILLVTIFFVPFYTFIAFLTWAFCIGTSLYVFISEFNKTR